jgi:hypothetical protein
MSSQREHGRINLAVGEAKYHIGRVRGVCGVIGRPIKVSGAEFRRWLRAGWLCENCLRHVYRAEKAEARFAKAIIRTRRAHGLERVDVACVVRNRGLYQR